jgi:tripartite-type tricarboxylate transporter receptor subunit TctC
MNRRELLGTLAALAAASPGLHAQTAYPNKAIRYIVPVAAGGGSDMVGRTVTERWGKLLGQTFVVDNQGGGGGVIACQSTMRAAPDGYTLLQGYVATHGTSPATRRLPYDAVKDFTPVGMIGATPNVLVVNTNLPVTNVAEFVAYVKKNPGKLSYGSAGQGRASRRRGGSGASSRRSASLTHLTMAPVRGQVVLVVTRRRSSAAGVHPVPAAARLVYTTPLEMFREAAAFVRQPCMRRTSLILRIWILAAGMRPKPGRLPSAQTITWHTVLVTGDSPGSPRKSVTSDAPVTFSESSVTMELFKQQINSFMVHIPYRGIAPAFTDLMGGQTQAMFPGLAAATPHIRSGRVRPLAVTGLARHPQYKDLPTLDEAGFKGFDAQQWYGVVGPAGMPAAVVKQLNDTLATVLRAPDLREKLSIEAIEPIVMSPEQLGDFIKTDIARWTALARARNIQLES